MKKQAKDLKPLDKIIIADQVCMVQSIDLSDIGKQGRRKCRIEALTPNKEKIIIIRPDDYPFDVL